MFLDDEELLALTKRRRRDAQIKALCAMGIEHRIRPDGTPAVLKAHIEKIFGAANLHSKGRKKTTPDFSLLP